MQAGKNITACQISETKNEQNKYPCYGGNGIRGYVSNYNKDGFFPIIGRQGALCGNINVATGKFYATEHAVVVETFGELDLRWGVYLLTQLNLNQYATATAQPGLSVNKISEAKLPFPPFAEQKRIVTELEKWLNLIDQLESDKTSLEASIKQAKSKILDLAIKGKLVSQDPSDEPAIEVLKRINPRFTPCDNSHYPFILKNGWCFAYGKDIFLQMINAKPIGKQFKYIDIDSINNKTHTIKPKIISTDKIPSRATRKTESGDIVFSMVRPYLKNIALVKESNCIASTGFFVCRSNGILNCNYLLYLMLSNYVVNGLNSYMKGDNSPSINNYHIQNYLYPVPPLAEQYRIVVKIEELFSILDKIQKSLEA